MLMKLQSFTKIHDVNWSYRIYIYIPINIKLLPGYTPITPSSLGGQSLAPRTGDLSLFNLQKQPGADGWWFDITATNFQWAATNSCGGFLKWRHPKMNGLSGKFPWKWMIWGFPYSRKPPCGFVQFLEKNTQIHIIAGVTVQVAILRGPWHGDMVTCSQDVRSTEFWGRNSLKDHSGYPKKA